MYRSYWTRLTAARIGRRRALAGIGGAAAAAAFLAACGGDDDDGGGSGAAGETGAASGLLITPVEQDSSAKRGGTLNIAGAPSTATLEQSLGGSGAGGLLIPNAYSQLMRIKMGNYTETPRGETEPEFAESYEFSPDGLTATFKLRGLKYDERAPTNGRTSNSEDVKYSWERWEANNTRRQDLSNNVTPDAPVKGVETPDDQTAVFNLAFPFAPFLAYLSSTFFPFMYPVEADGGYETKSVARGTGPWLLPDSRPSGDAIFDRNPNYYHETEPYFDKLHYHELTEYATIYAQFETGALEFHNGLIQEDVLKLKKDHPEKIMYQRPFFAKGSGGVFPGRRPDSIFNDQRVRRALSMGLDRKLWGDTYSNRAKFEAEGLPVEVKWHAGAGPGYHWWLDPEKDELGEASKNLQFNPEEAHKLLEATGLSLPIKTIWQASPGSTTGAVDHPGNQGMFGLFAATGDFEFEIKVANDFTEYLATVRDTHGDFEGLGLAFYNDHHDFDWTMFLKYHPTSTDFWMGMAGEDPKLTDFVNRQRRELDTEKREAIFQDFVKYDIEQLNYIPHFPADWKPYYIGQPWLGNWGWVQPYIEQYPNGAGQILTRYWYDESKKS
jgi:ABC-type transport system substrate-binding protein